MRVQPVPVMVLICIAHLSCYFQTGGHFERFEMTTTQHSATKRVSAEYGFPPALIDFKQLSAKVCMGRSRIYALIGEGNFPPPVKIGASSRWIDLEIDAYIAKLSTDRDSEKTGG